LAFIRTLQALVILSISLCANAQADTLKEPGEARRLTDQVMDKVGQGDVEGGLRILKPYLIIPPAEFDVMLGQIRMQLPAMSQRFGKSIGAEFIREDKIGDNLLRIVHIHRFERHAMRWSFYFYRGQNGWVLDTFKTDDDIRQLFP
jgi:hypothetical protein